MSIAILVKRKSLGSVAHAVLTFRTIPPFPVKKFTLHDIPFQTPAKNYHNVLNFAQTGYYK